MAYVEWMWTDADVMGMGLGRMNRIAWSSKKSLEDTMCDLRNVSGHNRGRQISIKARCGGITLKQNFIDVDSTFLGLLAIGEAWTVDKKNMTATSTVDCASRTYLNLCGMSDKTVATTVRWMWDDAGLTSVVPAYGTLAKKNPLRWSDSQSVANTAETLQMHAGSSCESRPVKLEISTATNIGLPVIVGACCPTLQEAVDILLEVVTQQCDTLTAGGSTRRSRASSVEEMFFFPLELEQALEDAEQVLKVAERTVLKEKRDQEVSEIKRREQNVELAEMLDRTTRQRKLKTEMLAEVARNLLADTLVGKVPSTSGSRKRSKSLGEELEGAVERRKMRMQRV